MSASAQWSDLGPRVISGVAMALVGMLAVWSGGWFFGALVCLVGGLMTWEVLRMFGLSPAGGIGVMAAAVLALAIILPGIFAVPLLLATGFVAAGQGDRDHPAVFAAVSWIMLGCFALLILRFDLGFVWVLWLVLVVIASDVAGYFAGRRFGGPKFWPRVSPKKTWSGTIAGWAGAAIVGMIFAGPTGAGAALIPVSVLTAFAGQMGDIGESALKRHTGVKDSSDLIPGHGGVFDRFDAMLGAGAVMLLLWAAGWVPGIA
ncbi:MAG: phosphatidate cytidylyltransferase [Rhodobacteraceae bacterium]|nr:phosphatidate cytidylyltransferase [Paracoccaceae bacterium]